jgi:hypothetical protein
VAGGGGGKAALSIMYNNKTRLFFKLIYVIALLFMERTN